MLATAVTSRQVIGSTAGHMTCISQRPIITSLRHYTDDCPTPHPQQTSDGSLSAKYGVYLQCAHFCTYPETPMPDVTLNLTLEQDTKAQRGIEA
jgi:hypothetical protein